MESAANHSQQTPKHHKRKTAWQAEGLHRHELKRLRPADIQARRNVGRTTEYRVRQLPGFPKPDAFGTYDGYEVDVFYDALKPADLAEMRKRPPRPSKGSTDMDSAAIVGYDPGAGAGIRPDTTSGIHKLAADPPNIQGKTGSGAQSNTGKGRSQSKTSKARPAGGKRLRERFQ
jgi:hypothetical protein